MHSPTLPPPALQFHELLSPSDPCFAGWMALYCLSFPAQERLSAGALADLMARKAGGEAVEVSQMAVLDERGKLAAMAIFRVYEQRPLAYLWYLAVDPNLRGQGTGAQVYREVLNRCRPETQAMIWEVERPELAPDADQRQVRQRRIHFYQLLGASLLDGLHFTIHPNPDMPPQEMSLMAHCLQPITAEELLQLIADLPELENLRQTGPLRFIGLEQS